MSLVPEEPAEEWCGQCGRMFRRWEGDQCPMCGGSPGVPPKIYDSEIEWLAAQKRRGGLQ